MTAEWLNSIKEAQKHLSNTSSMLVLDPFEMCLNSCSKNNKMIALNLLVDWRKIPEKIVEHSFKKCCIIKTLDSMENDTVKKNIGTDGCESKVI